MTTDSDPAEKAIDSESSATTLAPLPDRVGFGGMFAAVLGGRLIAGGGSQFADKPIWLNGQKSYTDRLFALEQLKGLWRVLDCRLPRPMAHFAAATDKAVAYLAGGISDKSALLAEVYAVKAEGETIVCLPLTVLPKPLAYGAGVVFAGRFYVAGGQHDLSKREATKEVWSLDLAQPVSPWQREPDLPGSGLFVGAMAACSSALFFIGGVGYDADGKAVQSKKVYALTPGSAAWTELPEMPEPRVGPVTPCPVIADQDLLVMGGYASAFTGERRDHPGFSRQTLVYNLASQQWRRGPVLPHRPPEDKDSPTDAGPAPMIAAPGVIWHDLFIAVGGEVRASVRTPAVIGLPLSSLSPFFPT